MFVFFVLKIFAKVHIIFELAIFFKIFYETVLLIATF